MAFASAEVRSPVRINVIRSAFFRVQKNTSPPPPSLPRLLRSPSTSAAAPNAPTMAAPAVEKASPDEVVFRVVKDSKSLMYAAWRIHNRTH